MQPRTHARRTTAVLTALALAVSWAATTTTATAAPGAAPAATAGDVTSPEEAARVDSVAAEIDWFDCTNVVGPRVDCGMVDLPLDYDDPTGPTTSVAVLRQRVVDPSRKVGTLFLNPGGPGGSGVSIASNAADFLPAAVLARFDVVGFDPRGTNFSTNVKCWNNLGEQTNDLLPTFETAFPDTTIEKADFVASAKKFGQKCSTTGQPLSASMSTANVARDMDVLRRTLGDAQLSYLGFSYGTYLGNVYANMFPDRVRAIVIDGVLDPNGWQGSPATADVPQTARIKSGEGAAKAVKETLKRCAAAGKKYCYTARLGKPAQVWKDMTTSLKKKPIDLGDGYRIDYPLVISMFLSEMYSDYGPDLLDMDIWALRSMQLDPPSKSEKAFGPARQLRERLKQFEAREAATQARTERLARAFDFPYDSSPEAFQSVLCTDGLNPRFASSWPSAAAAADKKAPGFGPLWTWASAPCASSTWTAVDEDAYRGTFDHVTANPVLVVGNYWDPATNYAGAVAAADLLPNSRLLSSNSWGHTAFLTSSCVDKAITTYLVTTKVPAEGKVCVGRSQPFRYPIDGAQMRISAVPPVGESHIVTPLPGRAPTL